MKTLDDYGGTSPEPPKKKDRKMSKIKTFIMKWNLTKECLTNEKGNPISNAIALKAMNFLDNDCIRKVGDEPSEDGRPGRQVWTCDPILGYNETAYTIKISLLGKAKDTILLSCNCQWASYDRFCSHGLATVIKAGYENLPRICKGGVRTDTQKQGSEET